MTTPTRVPSVTVARHGCIAATGFALDVPTREGAVARCATCSLREDCSALCPRSLERLGATTRRIARGEKLYRAGERFGWLFMIRSGLCKTVLLTDDGREQVAAFYLPGEFIGVDGIGMASHSCDAIALEDTEVCAFPFGRLEQLARRDPAIQRALYSVMTQEASTRRRVVLMLGTMRADQRLAAFLLDLARRYRDRGSAPDELLLRMTRDEIGSFLGLTLETVSRTFSHFQHSGCLQVDGRRITLVDVPGLERVLAPDLQ